MIKLVIQYLFGILIDRYYYDFIQGFIFFPFHANIQIGLNLRKNPISAN